VNLEKRPRDRSASGAVYELDPDPEIDPGLMRAVARSVPPVDSTAPPVEQVDLVAELDSRHHRAQPSCHGWRANRLVSSC
jgi:hypothetical protein